MHGYSKVTEWSYFKEAALLCVCRYQYSSCVIGYRIAGHSNLAVYKVLVVVGYTGPKKGSYFKFLRVPAYLMQYDLLSILTPFLLKSAKKWDSAVQKTKSDEGGLWGVLKMTIWTKYFILHHTVLVLVLSCIFLWSKNPFVKVPRKLDPPYS